MALRKKEIVPEISGHSSAFTLPNLMTTMSAPHVTLPLSMLTPAPLEWNFFAPLPDGKFLELCDSIEQHGLIHPLLIWAREDGVHVILSGHNRVRALQSLFEATQNQKYFEALCVVRHDLTEKEAQALVIDANWVGRVLSPSEKARCVARRYAEQGRLERGTGMRAYDKVAIHFGLKATQVYNYVKIASLPPDILSKVDEGVLSLRAAAALSKLSEPDLRTLQQDLGGSFNSKQVLNTLSGKPYESLTFLVPKDKVEAVQKAVRNIIVGSSSS